MFSHKDNVNSVIYSIFACCSKLYIYHKFVSTSSSSNLTNTYLPSNPSVYMKRLADSTLIIIQLQYLASHENYMAVYLCA
jgi:hypothetical protein